ncbi:MAG: hypothetical protein K6G57_03625 [Lachnospiraceae bacterium]|nr:hypothetical protein [Lachnospiraceae bacterium]
MKCPKCGAETQGTFCSNCGSNVYNPSSQNVQQPINSSVNNRGIFQPDKKKNSKLGIVAFVLSFLGYLAVVGIGVAIYDLVKDKAKEYKHTLSVAALIIGAIVVLALGSPSRTDRSSSTDTPVATQTSSSDSKNASNVSSNNSGKSSEKEESKKDPEPSPAPTVSKDEFISSCTELNYKAIARNPDDYVGQNFCFTCYVSSAREGGFLSGYQKYFVTYGFDMEKAQESVNEGWAESLADAKYMGMDYDVCVWLLDNRNEKDSDYVKILEDDIITVYGTFTGMTETQNSLTKETGEIVSLDIKYVELIEE